MIAEYFIVIHISERKDKHKSMSESEPCSENGIKTFFVKKERGRTFKLKFSEDELITDVERAVKVLWKTDLDHQVTTIDENEVSLDPNQSLKDIPDKSTLTICDPRVDEDEGRGTDEEEEDFEKIELISRIFFLKRNNGRTIKIEIDDVTDNTVTNLDLRVRLLLNIEDGVRIKIKDENGNILSPETYLISIPDSSTLFLLIEKVSFY